MQRAHAFLSPVRRRTVMASALALALSLAVLAEARAAGPAALPAVSYTHLTLPTNREV